ncbi:DNA methyltransferase, partial [Bacillus cereus]|uniref:DNA methyltransferase n=1 Tax=Bacillus cereus TaxID=1396 RepID=UPI0034D74B1E
GTGWIFWNKLNGLDNCFSDGEFAYSSKGIQSKYFECSTFHDLKGGKSRIHPTEKPVKLYSWILKNFAKENDKILDTNLGSGSIAIAID